MARWLHQKNVTITRFAWRRQRKIQNVLMPCEKDMDDVQENRKHHRTKKQDLHHAVQDKHTLRYEQCDNKTHLRTYLV